MLYIKYVIVLKNPVPDTWLKWNPAALFWCNQGNDVKLCA